MSLLDSNEYALYLIKNEIEELESKIDIVSVIGSVINRERMREVCSSFDVQTIYHSAAYKHVSLVEENPFEAVSNNIYGTKICAESADETGVETFVLISTDKAVRPTNIMGATKRMAELSIQALNKTDSNTKFSMVRFGNVINSSGSVVPLFIDQIANGGPITLTHKDVERYFMTIPEASNLVIQAGEMSQGGEVFILDMGEQMKVIEIAKRLIHLSGRSVADHSGAEGIEIIEVGLRPGEKMYEELLISGDEEKTDNPRIFKSNEKSIDIDMLEEIIQICSNHIENDNFNELANIMTEHVEGFNYE